MSEMQSGDKGDEVAFRQLNQSEESPFSSGVFSLLCELRPGLTQRTFRELISVGYAQGLRFLAAHHADGNPVAVAGYRVLTTSRGRIFYVDDLVTAETKRSRGTATAVVGELKRRARLADCARLELDSAVTNATAHRFYLGNRLDITAFHFGVVVDL